MKLSQFNVVHEHNGSLLIMNARTGGILSLNPEYAQKFKRIQEGDVRDADDLVAELISGGILVNEERTSLGRSGCKVAPRALRILLCPLPLRQRWLATFAVPTAMKRDRRTRRWARRF